MPNKIFERTPVNIDGFSLASCIITYGGKHTLVNVQSHSQFKCEVVARKLCRILNGARREDALHIQP